MAEFKKGDVVQLKSERKDGIKMTIDAYLPKFNKFQCQWFDGSEFKKGLFNPESLRKVEE